MTTISTYEKNLDGIESNVNKDLQIVESYFDLTNKKLVDIQKDQSMLEYKWLKYDNQLYLIQEVVDVHAKDAFGKAYEVLRKDSHVDYSSTDIKAMVECDRSYQEYKILQARIKVVRKDVQAVLTALESRRYQIKNMTDVIIKECDQYLL